LKQPLGLKNTLNSGTLDQKICNPKNCYGYIFFNGYQRAGTWLFIFLLWMRFIDDLLNS